MSVANVFAGISRLRGGIAVTMILMGAIIVPDQTRELLFSYLDKNTDLQIKIPFLLATVVTSTLYAIIVSSTTYLACCADNSDTLRQKISWRIDPWWFCVGLSLLPIASLVIATVPGSIDELDSAMNALLHYSDTLFALFVGLVVALAAAHVRRRNSAQGERLWHAIHFSIYATVTISIAVAYAVAPDEVSLSQFVTSMLEACITPPALFLAQTCVLGWFLLGHFPRRAGILHQEMASWTMFLVAVAPFALFCVAFTISPLSLPSVVAPVGLLFCFGFSLAFALNILVIFNTKTGIPMISILAGLAFVFSGLNLNDNHRVRSADVDAEQSASVSNAQRPSTYDFADWLAHRPDITKFESSKYPVYIVAAAGGGAYAGYYSALYLAKMQDRCPDFASHIFAISGVSGGSVGSSLFHSLLGAAPPANDHKGCEAPQEEPGELARQTKAFFSADFLSPLLAATLFNDFAQRFIPYPIQTFDRVRSLERSFELSWAEIFPNQPNPYTSSEMLNWTPKSIRPALFLNATDVETGSRVVISPLTISHAKWQRPHLSESERLQAALDREGEAENYANSHFTIDYFVDLNASKNLALSTAAAISARFPFVTPPASVVAELPFTPDDGDNIQKRAYLRLVDGGYNDNSGVATAMDIIDSIERATDPKVLEQVQINLLILDVRRPTARDLKLDAASRSTLPGFAEILSPLNTLAGIRQARLVDVIGAAVTRLDRDYTGGEPIAFKRVRAAYIFSARGDDLALRYGNYRIAREVLPLGWRLSSRTKDQIERSAFSGCTPSQNMISAVSNNELSYKTSMSDPYADASCVSWMIVKEVANDMAQAQVEISKSTEAESFPGLGVCTDHADEFPACQGD